MWHSCVQVTVEDHLARVPERIGLLYYGFEAMVRACGPVEVVPVKTYISLTVRVRFAFAFPQQSALRLRLECPRMFDSPRVVRVEHYNTVVGNYLRIARADELDDELAAWVALSYAHGAGRPAPSVDVDDAVVNALACIERRDWARLHVLLHPYLHWTDRHGTTVRGRTTVLAYLAGQAGCRHPRSYELRGGQIYRWIE
jgi:Domain of unknown function (DUF5655)